jgi:hypothetical protein
MSNFDYKKIREACECTIKALELLDVPEDTEQFIQFIANFNLKMITKLQAGKN